ncbi:hypothetical protein D3C84_1091670 [compost metagenome]
MFPSIGADNLFAAKANALPTTFGSCPTPPGKTGLSRVTFAACCTATPALFAIASIVEPVNLPFKISAFFLFFKIGST